VSSNPRYEFSRFGGTASRLCKSTKMSAFLLRVLLVVAAIYMGGAFHYQAMSTRQNTMSSSLTSTRILATASQQLDRSSVLDRSTEVRKRHSRQDQLNNEDDDSFNRWVLKLNDDQDNTRSYVCECLVRAAKLTEEESYLKMMTAHQHGEAIIGEYCREHAEYYKEALTSSGLVCEIFPINCE
jgi:ATP-dependent Clp protease adapter protein ClpS